MMVRRSGVDTSLRLLQFCGLGGRRRVIAARGRHAAFVSGSESVLSLARSAIASGRTLAQCVAELGTEEKVDLHAALEAGQLLPPIDHPDPTRILLSGTGLTHLGSAEGRDRMHRAAADPTRQTDSMRIFLEGLEGGKPSAGETGCQPEWFYKGNGHHLVGPGRNLHLPSYAADGGEEPELAGIYLISEDGTPCRIGICLANEFSDHVTEKHNYLWLAHSKLRQAALGAELLTGSLPDHVEGTSRILRDGAIIWERPFLTGEANMSHSLANLEHHHFKYPIFRKPGDIHIHFFGTATISFSDGVRTREGDVFEIEAAPFSLPLRNGMACGSQEMAKVRIL